MTAIHEEVRATLRDLRKRDDKVISTVTAGHLARYMDASTCEIGTALARLEQSGAVERTQGGADMRRYRVTLDEEVPA